MALVPSTGQPTRHVAGNLVFRFLTVSGPTGSTVDTGIQNILWTDVQSFNAAGTASLITGLSFTSTSSILTLTSSAPMVNEVIEVIGLKG